MQTLARLIKEETRMYCKKIARLNREFFKQMGIKHLVKTGQAMTHSERIEKLESLIKTTEKDCTLLAEAVLFLLREALTQAKQANGVSTSSTKTLSEQSGQTIAQGIKDAWSPPPDVVEAARRCIEASDTCSIIPDIYLQTVCKWVLNIKSV